MTLVQLVMFFKLVASLHVAGCTVVQAVWLQGCRLQVAGCKVVQALWVQGCRLQVAGCRPENIVEGCEGVTLQGPEPTDRSVSKAKFEASIQRWRDALKQRANDIRRIREGWPAA
jgi:hypothetical protein